MRTAASGHKTVRHGLIVALSPVTAVPMVFAAMDRSPDAVTFTVSGSGQQPAQVSQQLGVPAGRTRAAAKRERGSPREHCRQVTGVKTSCPGPVARAATEGAGRR